MIFCVWLLSLSIIFSRFLHVLACVSTSFLFGGWIRFFVWYTIFYLSSHLLMDTWIVSIFRLFWIILQWTLAHNYLFESLFSVRLGIYLVVELLGHLIILHLTFWGDTKHLFMCILAICIFSLEKYLFKFFAHLKILGCWSLCCWIVGVLYIFWTVNPYKLYDLQIFSSILYFCHFTFLIIFFDAQKFLISMRSSWFFLLLLVLLGVIFKKLLPKRSWRFTTMFSSKSL